MRAAPRQDGERKNARALWRGNLPPCLRYYCRSESLTNLLLLLCCIPSRQIVISSPIFERHHGGAAVEGIGHQLCCAACSRAHARGAAAACDRQCAFRHEPEEPRRRRMDRQTLRDWVIRYNAHGPDGLYDCWGDGRPPRLEPGEQAELIRIVFEGPGPERAFGVYARGPCPHLRARFGDLPPASLGRLLSASASRGRGRPSHPKDPAQAEAFKGLRRCWTISTRLRQRLRLFFQDEARIGQGAFVTSGGSAGSVRRGSAISASPSLTSSQPWSQARTMLRADDALCRYGSDASLPRPLFRDAR